MGTRKATDFEAKQAAYSLDLDPGMLENVLGAKLDRVLAENKDTSMFDMEADLRRAASSSENRTMAEPMVRAYLALLLHRQGRHEEAVAEMSRGFNVEGLNISSSGAWIGANAAGYHMHDAAFAAALVQFFHAKHAHSVVDL